MRGRCRICRCHQSHLNALLCNLTRFEGASMATEIASAYIQLQTKICRHETGHRKGPWRVRRPRCDGQAGPGYGRQAHVQASGTGHEAHRDWCGYRCGRGCWCSPGYRFPKRSSAAGHTGYSRGPLRRRRERLPPRFRRSRTLRALLRLITRRTARRPSR